MKEFQLTLRNEKRKQYILIAFLFILINCIALLYLGFAAATTFPRILFFIQAGAILVSILIDHLSKKNANYQNRTYLIVAMVLAGLAWLKNDYWWAFGLCMIVAFLFAATNRALLVTLESTRIIYPSFPKRKINWDILNNVMLKDGLLTIDFKSNKLIQQRLDESVTTVNEKEFNEFCKEQLKR